MKPLSERLNWYADVWPTCPNTEATLIPLLREAAALAKRYEDAPVADLNWDWFSPSLAQGIVRIDKPDADGLSGFLSIQNNCNVRLVREPARRDG